MHAALLHNKLWASCIMCVTISLVWTAEVRALAAVSRESINFVGVCVRGGGGAHKLSKFMM